MLGRSVRTHQEADDALRPPFGPRAQRMEFHHSSDVSPQGWAERLLTRRGGHRFPAARAEPGSLRNGGATMRTIHGITPRPL
jgi:hypothetical protein